MLIEFLLQNCVYFLLLKLLVFLFKAVCVPPAMSQELMYRIALGPVHVAKEPIPPRHRRKRRDDDVLVTSTGAQATQTAATTTATNTTRETVNNSRGAQFDLEDSAFPPLPGKLDCLQKFCVMSNVLIIFLGRFGC